MSEYWRPEPKRHEFAWWALLVPALIYSAGVIVYAHAALSPADIARNGHAVGSALMVIGGESGTLAAASEVFRKARVETSKATVWDWGGLIVSLVATLGNLFVVYAAISTLDTDWIDCARDYGPLALLLCSGLDFYANVMEFGFFNASYERRWSEWNDARHSYERAQATRKANVETQASQDALGVAETETQSDPDSAHVNVRKDAESYACDYCGRSGFATPQAVSAHLRFCDAYQSEKAEASE